MLEARTCPSISADTTSEEENMYVEIQPSYKQAFTRVNALLRKHGIELRKVGWSRKDNDDPFSADDDAFCDRNGLRLIVRERIEDYGPGPEFSFEIEMGRPFADADSVSEHHVRVSFSQENEYAEEVFDTPESWSTSAKWSLSCQGSSEALALLTEIDPKLTTTCLKDESINLYCLPASFDRSVSNEEFFFSVINNMLRIFAAAANAPAQATA
jgi:hypothetical protein